MCMKSVCVCAVFEVCVCVVFVCCVCALCAVYV